MVVNEAFESGSILADRFERSRVESRFVGEQPRNKFWTRLGHSPMIPTSFVCHGLEVKIPLQ